MLILIGEYSILQRDHFLCSPYSIVRYEVTSGCNTEQEDPEHHSAYETIRQEHQSHCVAHEQHKHVYRCEEAPNWPET